MVISVCIWPEQTWIKFGTLTSTEIKRGNICNAFERPNIVHWCHYAEPKFKVQSAIILNF